MGRHIHIVNNKWTRRRYDCHA